MNEELRNKIMAFLKEKGYGKVKVFASNCEEGFLYGICGLLHKPYPESWAIAAQKIKGTELNNTIILDLKEMVK
jgi:hypothetical protein